MKKKTNITESMKSFLDVIPSGRENAIHAKSIASWTGLSTREIKMIIQSLREFAYPICSTTQEGYWLATNKEDIIRTLYFLESQKRQLGVTINGLKKSMRNL